MGFRARKIRNINLFDGPADHHNAFTIVVGDNGSGKTNLLIDTTQYYLTQYDELLNPRTIKERRELKHALRAGGFIAALNLLQTKQLPNKLICASTSQFERFPHKFNKNQRWYSQLYSYIGSKPYYPDVSPAFRIGATAISQLFAYDSLDNRKISALVRFLEEFNFGSTLKLKFRPTIKEKELQQFRKTNPEWVSLYNQSKLLTHDKKIGQVSSDATQEESNELSLESKLILKNASEDFEHDEILDLLYKLEHVHHQPEILVGLNDSQLITYSAESGHADLGYTKRDISQLLLAGLIVIEDIKTVKNQPSNSYKLSKDAKVQSLSSRSSGEQCLFLLFLGILSSIENQSLILIDEPEISLHPSWQQRFVEILRSSLKNFTGCHFIIATHSPLIVSDISSQYCQILDIKNNILFDAKEQFHRSSDYQLATIFGNPGHYNEYLLKSAMYVFSKYRTNLSFDEGDCLILIELNKHLNDLDETDPVKVLVSLLNEVKARHG
ncbi:AAA family ATPase [Pseudoalteromonas sp. YIC-656]|uniref:AAA family ATPase n=1 Tax=Pseudoalteromonas pernae TaxID=3118054 RepID=UPI003242DF5F